MSRHRLVTAWAASARVRALLAHPGTCSSCGVPTAALSMCQLLSLALTALCFARTPRAAVAPAHTADSMAHMRDPSSSRKHSPHTATAPAAAVAAACRLAPAHCARVLMLALLLRLPGSLSCCAASWAVARHAAWAGADGPASPWHGTTATSHAWRGTQGEQAGWHSACVAQRSTLSRARSALKHSPEAYVEGLGLCWADRGVAAMPHTGPTNQQ